MPRILIIDDEELVRFALREILEDVGHVVQEAADGEFGLESFNNCRADIVIMDIIMPKMEGIETIAELKRIKPDCKIIAVSGGGRGGAKNYLKLAAHMGADRTIPKPFGRKQILDNIDALLSGK